MIITLGIISSYFARNFIFTRLAATHAHVGLEPKAELLQEWKLRNAFEKSSWDKPIFYTFQDSEQLLAFTFIAVFPVKSLATFASETVLPTHFTAPTILARLAGTCIRLGKKIG